MKVKDILIRAALFVGREDIAALLKNGEELSGEDTECVQTLLYCFNAVEDELARHYFALKAKEEFTSDTGEFRFDSFLFSPVKILSVQAEGKSVEYSLFPLYIRCNAKQITVEYEYAPAKKTIEGSSVYDGSVVGEKLIASGAAAEYFLINGCVQQSKLWESKYRSEIDLAQRKFYTSVTVPPRRWV